MSDSDSGVLWTRGVHSSKSVVQLVMLLEGPRAGHRSLNNLALLCLKRCKTWGIRCPIRTSNGRSDYRHRISQFFSPSRHFMATKPHTKPSIQLTC